jgi:hypothetical protein
MPGERCLGAGGEGLLQWEESFLDGSFAPAKKGALQSVKPSAARARSGWYWSTVKVFRWEFGLKVPIREKLRLRKPRWPKSASQEPRADRGKMVTDQQAVMQARCNACVSKPIDFKLLSAICNYSFLTFPLKAENATLSENAPCSATASTVH